MIYRLWFFLKWVGRNYHSTGETFRIGPGLAWQLAKILAEDWDV